MNRGRPVAPAGRPCCPRPCAGARASARHRRPPGDRKRWPRVIPPHARPAPVQTGEHTMNAPCVLHTGPSIRGPHAMQPRLARQVQHGPPRSGAHGAGTGDVV